MALLPVRLYDQINELEIQRDNYLEETRNKQSPAEERERLLKQVKDDNQEIASLERQSVVSLHPQNHISS
jgi:intraflagellar transport protein 74